MLPTIIASVALVAIVAWAIYYIVSRKKRGAACIGCPVEGTCAVTQAYSDHVSGVTPVSIQPYSSHDDASPRKAETGSGCHCGCNHVK